MSNNFLVKRSNLEQLHEDIKLLAIDENIKQWDLGGSSSNDLSVQVDHGEAKQLKGSQRNSITIRVWNNSKILGITSTTDLSSYGIQKAFKGAVQASHFGNINEIPEFSKEAQNELPQINNTIREPVGISKLLDILKKAESDLINSHTYIDSVPYNGLAEATIDRFYINSDRVLRQMRVTQASIYLYAKGEKIGEKPRSAGSVEIATGVNDLDIKSCINEASEKIISHINYKPIKTGKYLVCFSPEAFLDLIGAFSNIFNARSILDGVSLSTKDSLGKDISVPFFSLSDDALHPENIASFTFDGEGTPKKTIKLIENGVLKNLLHSEFTARKFGVRPSGHGSLGAKASVSPDWFVVEKTNRSTCHNNELTVKNCTDKFVLIDNLNALHAGVKSSQGSFSLPFDGWLVDSGNKISIDSATVAGGIKELLSNIIQIEDNQIVTHQGISPYIWVDNLSITGEA